MWRQHGALTVVSLMDLLGGLFPALLIMATGFSRPGWLVVWLTDNPTMGWMTVGVLGPVAADHTFIGSAAARAQRWLRYQRFRDQDSARLPEGLVRETAVQEIAEGVASLAFGELHSLDVQLRNEVERRVAGFGLPELRSISPSARSFLDSVDAQPSTVVNDHIERFEKSVSALTKKHPDEDAVVALDRCRSRAKSLLHALLDDGQREAVKTLLNPTAGA